MTTKTVDTAAGDLKYKVEVQQFDSLDEFSDLCETRGESPDDALLGILNAAQEQNAKQGNKEAVRKALREADGDASAEPVQEAIVAHQTASAAYLIGKPRGPVGGVKKADRTDIGTAVVKFTTEHGKPPSGDELAGIMAELGITLP